jgi:LysM repeat protein
VGTYVAVAVAVLVVVAVVFVLLADRALRGEPEMPELLQPVPTAAPELPSPSERAAIAIPPDTVTLDLEVATPATSPPPTPTGVPVRAETLPKYFLYTVQPGESLAAIASRFGYSFEEIAAINGIDEPYVLQIGEELLIPNR